MRKLVVATYNRHKLREIRQILQALDPSAPGLNLLSLSDLPLPLPLEEKGASFRENALCKARTVAEALGELTIADDSGLEVDALDGRPGIYSARFSGPRATDLENIIRLLEELAGVPPERRQARFRCVIALADITGEHFLFEGSCEGVIGTSPKGERGFGYDPVFIIPQYGKTLAEAGSAIKNRISHRTQALKQAWPAIKRLCLS